MKKFIFASIFLFWIFAIQNSFAACYNNYRYNWQLVRYCDWDHPDYGYNNISYYNWDNWYYDDDNNYVNDVYYEHYYDDYNGYNNNYYYEWITSNEENSIKIKYLNNLWWPGDVSTKKDFFKTNVIGNDKEFSAIDAINVKSISYKASSWNSKYSDAVKFFSALKDEIKTRYLEWKINYNQIYDIKNDLETLVYNLNNQFSYYKKYESSKSNTYKDMAEDSATQVRTGYNKLKSTLNNL